MINELNSQLRQYSRSEGVDPAALLIDIQRMERAHSVSGKIETVKTKLRNLGMNPTISDAVIFGIDEKICGETQLPAYRYFESGGTVPESRSIALRRLAVGVTKGTSIVGAIATSWGFSEKSPSALVYGAGLALQGGADFAENRILNSTGSRWNNHLTRIIMHVEHLTGMLKNNLVDGGYTHQEIEAIGDIGTNTYSAELNSSTLNRLENHVMPFAVAGTMISYDQYLLAGAVAFLGSMAIPVGEKAYIESNIKRKSANRSARSAKAGDWLEALGIKHVNMVSRLNLISQADRVLQVLNVIFGRSDPSFIANVFGIGIGLKGLHGTLSMQRSREDSRRFTKFAERIVNLISSPNLILTLHRWLEHVKRDGISSLECPPVENGIYIKEFKTKLPNGQFTNLPEVTLAAESGTVTALIGKSGDGKSTFFTGPLHIAEHTGDCFIINDGQATDVHMFRDQRAIDNYMKMISVDMVSPNSRIVDIFRSTYIKTYNDELEIDKKDRKLWEYAKQVSDNLLQEELSLLENIRNSSGSTLSRLVGTNRSYFPARMLEPLKHYRESRLKWVNEKLKTAGGNLAIDQISATSRFGDGSMAGGLSSGQRQRVVMLFAEVLAESESDLKALIFDEPLDKLDESENLVFQLETIRKIQEMRDSPAILIITHQHINALAEATGARLVNLNNPRT
ncbi:MAG: ATP-binding cassette domain-containing protein [bacterium]|nr:ATP-binding cassette domain-containing protein [bacterium]